jgi:hypothetical protein
MILYQKLLPHPLHALLSPHVLRHLIATHKRVWDLGDLTYRRADMDVLATRVGNKVSVLSPPQKSVYFKTLSDIFEIVILFQNIQLI